MSSSSYSVFVNVDSMYWDNDAYNPQHLYFENISKEELKEKLKPYFIELIREKGYDKISKKELKEFYEHSFPLFFKGIYPIIVIEDRDRIVERLISLGAPLRCAYGTERDVIGQNFGSLFNDFKHLKYMINEVIENVQSIISDVSVRRE